MCNIAHYLASNRSYKECSFHLSALTAKEAGGGGGGAASSGGVMVVDVVKADEIGCERLPTPSKLQQLRYAGYSAEFLDRVEPNGNIPHKQIEGKRRSAVSDTPTQLAMGEKSRRVYISKLSLFNFHMSRIPNRVREIGRR